MTDLEKNLIKEEGIKEGKAQILILLLMKKFKKLPENYKEKIKKLSNESLYVLATDIFEINSAEELEKYF